MTLALGYLSLPSECAGDGQEQVVNAAAGAFAAFAQQADLLVVHPFSANDCGGPDLGAPGTDPVDGHPDQGRRYTRGGLVGARR